MKKVLLKLARLMFGFFLYGLGISLTINADLGLAPWGVFHQGLSNQLGITFGNAIIITGATIVILDLFLKILTPKTDSAKYELCFVQGAEFVTG